MKQFFQIDPEFKRLSVPLSAEEERRLEKSLMREGCKDPIVVWNGCILDGHKRYEVCSYEEIEHETVRMDFATREEAIIWVCKKRMETLTPDGVMYKYLGGRRYACEKIRAQAIRKERRKQELETGIQPNTGTAPSGRVSIPLARELGINRTTIEKYGTFADSMEQIANKDPLMFDVICQGKAVMSYAKISHLAKSDVSKVVSTRRKFLKEEDTKMRRRAPRKKVTEEQGQKNEPERVILPLEMGIKEMPAFDPDMEFRGLTLTIPTWMNAIVRSRSKTNIAQVSESTKKQLAANLRRLEEQIMQTLEVIEK